MPCKLTIQFCSGARGSALNVRLISFEMRAYIIVTGLAFAGILVAHLLRIIAEGVHLFREPGFVVSSMISVGLTAWATVLVLRRRNE